MLILALMEGKLFCFSLVASISHAIASFRGSAVIKLVNISLTKPHFLRKAKSVNLSNAAAQLLAGVEQQQHFREKEAEVFLPFFDVINDSTYDLLHFFI